VIAPHSNRIVCGYYVQRISQCGVSRASQSYDLSVKRIVELNEEEELETVLQQTSARRFWYQRYRTAACQRQLGP